MKNCLALITTVALALPAHASLTGASVTTSYVVPPGTIFQSGEFYSQTATIGSSQEFTAFGFAKNVQIDFTEDKVSIAHTRVGRTIYDVGSIVFKFDNKSDVITAVSVLDPGVPMYTYADSSQRHLFEQSRISFSDHAISLFMGGLLVPGVSVLKLSISTSPVPEPTTALLFAMGALSLYAANRLSRGSR